MSADGGTIVAVATVNHNGEGGVYLSTDSGANWNSVVFGGSASLNLVDVAVAGSGSRLSAVANGGQGGQVWISADAGTTWAPAPTTPVGIAPAPTVPMAPAPTPLPTEYDPNRTPWPTERPGLVLRTSSADDSYSYKASGDGVVLRSLGQPGLVLRGLGRPGARTRTRQAPRGPRRRPSPQPTSVPTGMPTTARPTISLAPTSHWFRPHPTRFRRRTTHDVYRGLARTPETMATTEGRDGGTANRVEQGSDRHAAPRGDADDYYTNDCVFVGAYRRVERWVHVPLRRRRFAGDQQPVRLVQCVLHYRVVPTRNSKG